jgi:hypothetical protein
MAWRRSPPHLPNQVRMGANVARQEPIAWQEFLNCAKDL